jgi:uncharacterized protein YyaL (SSP411 family)
VAIVGDPGASDTVALVGEVLRRRWLPNVVLGVVSPVEPDLEQIALLAERPQVDGKATAYVCERFVCRQPVTTTTELRTALAPQPG